MQETKQLTMPVSKAVVVIRGYMTGLIDQEIRKVTLGGNKSHFEKQVDPSQGEDQFDSGPMTMVMDTDPTVEIEADNKRLELMVLSIDGEQDNIIDKVLALPKEDVNYLQSQIKGIETDSKVEAAGPKAPTS